MGLTRNLSADEILQQVWFALQAVRRRSLNPLVNIVFMGMGEPLDNLQEVARAVEQLTNPEAFSFSPRAITVSTVGPSPSAVLAASATLRCKLAWSVHAADDELRRRLVPTTKCLPICVGGAAAAATLLPRLPPRVGRGRRTRRLGRSAGPVSGYGTALP